MEVTLLGTGDTTGTPVPGCSCDTCRRARELGVERTRFSVHVRAGGSSGEPTDAGPDAANGGAAPTAAPPERSGQSLLVDFSPDFRHQFLRDAVALPDAGIVTHVHYDHLGGLGNVYRLVDDLPVLAASERDPATGESVAATVRDRFDYLDAVSVRPVEPAQPVECRGFEVTLVPVDHPPLASYGVRIEELATGATLAITGDTSYAVPERSRRVLSDADLLLVDGIVPASYCERHPAGGDHPDDRGLARTFGTKHATREGALALVDELAPAEFRIVHCSHHYPADGAFEAPLAVDGERFEL